MKLNNLIKLNIRTKKRLGRGLGSGKGKTAGRGTKGQKARGKVNPIFVGSNFPLYKTLPLKKGKGNRQVTEKVKVINLETLTIFKDKAVIDLNELLKNNIINRSDMKRGVKILGNGDLDKAFVIKLPVSKAALIKIEAAGGRVENG